MANYYKIYVDKKTFEMVPKIIEIYDKYHPDSKALYKPYGFAVTKAFMKYIEDDEI